MTTIRDQPASGRPPLATAPVGRRQPRRMRLVHRSATLRLRDRFAISRGSFSTAKVVRVGISIDGVTGYGEGAPIPRHEESVDSARAFLDDIRPLLGDDPFALEEIERRMNARPGEMAARCALDAALQDLTGRLTGRPVWRMLGLARRGAATSYTISLDDPDAMARAAITASTRFRRLKLKLGGRDGLDVERVRAVRSITPLPLQVDVNEGWELSEALAALAALDRLGVECVEQPLPAGHDGAAELRARSPIPIYLDEECAGVPDMAACAERGHGVNVKLSKAGGIRAALRAIDAARARGLGVMVGCMIESTLGIAAACQIASLCDYVDLDANLFVAGDRWSGVVLADGIQTPADGPGLGVERLRWPRWR